MSAVILLSEARAETARLKAVPVHGVGRVAYGRSGGQTRLKDLYQRDPVRVLFPTPPRNEIPSAVFVTTSGGLVGGDVLELTAQVEENVAAQATAQAAEKVYRSTAADCRIEIALEVARGAWLEWLPQETIVFDGARLKRHTAAEVAEGGRLLAGEILVLGRRAMGEAVTTGLIRDDWDVRRNGRVTWSDAFCLDRDIAHVIAHPAGLGGARAVATAVYVADDAESRLATARAILAAMPETVRCGATCVNGVLVVRFLSADALFLRRAFAEFWAAFRHAVAGLPAQLPRIWQI